MNEEIENTIEFLLDIETTSEILFYETIANKQILYDVRYESLLKKIVDRKFEHWRTYYQEKQYANAKRTSIETGKAVSGNESSSEAESETLSDTDDDNELTAQVFRSTKLPNLYIDPVEQCQRLLQFLYYGQTNHSHFINLYFYTLEHCIKDHNDKIGEAALLQIALNLLNDTQQQERLIQCLPSNLSSSTIPDKQKPILEIIKNLVSKRRAQEDFISFFSGIDIDVLYPYSAHYLDVHREFRDSQHYFIDGDSLIISIAHHVNVNLNSYYGNTLHVIFIIERILLGLFNQARRPNYSLIFFDCHYLLYESEHSILTLLRSCLIAHLSKNMDKYGHLSNIRKFSSWIDNEYKQFVREEQPHFMFYHDMSSFINVRECLLSASTLQKMIAVYHLFGNFHQYHLKCNLYLMNKLSLAETIVQCFSVQFMGKCSLQLFKITIQSILSYKTNATLNNDDFVDFEKQVYATTGQNDVRITLYLQAIKRLMETENIEMNLWHYLGPLLILHVSLIVRLSLIDRHIPSNIFPVTFSPVFSESISRFQRQLGLCLSMAVSSLSSSYAKVADMFDGRLFVFTLYRLHEMSAKIKFDSDTLNIVNPCLALLNISNVTDRFPELVNELANSKHILFLNQVANTPSMTAEKRQIAKISNSFIDAFLQPALLNDHKWTFDFFNPNNTDLPIYEGKHHWHVYKEVGDEFDRIRDKDNAFKKAKHYRYRTTAQQKFYTYFSLYGKSLTSRDIKDREQDIILPVGTINEVATTDDKKRHRGKSQAKVPHQKKADKIIEENKQRKAEKFAKEEAEQVKIVDDLLAKISHNNYSEAIETINSRLPMFKTPTNRLELLKRKFNLQRAHLRNLRKKTGDRIDLEYIQVALFATMTEMAHLESASDLFENRKEYLEELVGESPLSLESWYRFQMETVNSRIPRREQGEPDSRVPEFIPDSWQVEFLNAVDKQQSVIIVAPTASGKTYASYYAMNKVLRDPNDPNGICVYVAPTKALVNQVAATIYSKFGPVFGVFTRDYRENMDGCRILVTVPQCMEILLLSPRHQRWCGRMKYAIFDEIHCMSGEIGSDVWEKTMLLTNCPMIGLSATVNNGEDLRDWITRIESERAKLFNSSNPRSVCFISYHERMADLNKYLYSNKELHQIHPIGVMHTKQLTTRGVPKDLSLSPKETLQLNDAMKTSLTDRDKSSIKAKPVPALTNYFSPDSIIERNKCNAYSQLVCKQFINLVENHEKEAIDSITSVLSPTASKQIQYPEAKPLEKLIVELVLTLKEKDLLPCIVFSDSRLLCEQMATHVAEYFERLEIHLRETKYKNQIELLKTKVENIDKAQKKAKTKKATRTRTQSDEDIAEQNMKEEEEKEHLRLSGFEQQILTGILDEATLAKRQGCDQQLVDTLIERASRENRKLVSYMKRGVAYHHAGVNNKGRVAVEALFRNRYIQVVFSTATLALGIHMPTKSVAFAKDSIYLDALQYRQSSGRAGRRGFDIQGHVIFVDIPLSKISHLMISSVPNIRAHLPTSVTFLMRLLHLNSRATDKKSALNRSLIALQCPLLTQTCPVYPMIDIQTRLHFLFTLDFLYQLNLVNEYGDLVGLAGLSTHLHYFEPMNIFLVYLMANNYFSKMHNPTEVMTLFARLFTNMPWLITHSEYEKLTEHRRILKYNSKLFLPMISKQFRTLVDKYNDIVKTVYGCYIANVTKYLRSIYDKQIEMLPFSNVSFTQNLDYNDGSFEYNLHHHQSQQSQNPSISPFASVSGLTHEQFMSNYNSAAASWDLVYDLAISSKMIPFIDVDCRDHTNTAYYLNSYALDFFKHGSDVLLIEENELNPGDIYALLLDINLVLLSVKTSLEVIIKNDTCNGIDIDSAIKSSFSSLHTVQGVFSKRFHHQYPFYNRT